MILKDKYEQQTLHPLFSALTLHYAYLIVILELLSGSTFYRQQHEAHTLPMTPNCLTFSIKINFPLLEAQLTPSDNAKAAYGAISAYKN